MELFGRKQIFTDELNIDATNILPVLSEAYTIHEMNRSEIQYLFEYAMSESLITWHLKFLNSNWDMNSARQLHMYNVQEKI